MISKTNILRLSLYLIITVTFIITYVYVLNLIAKIAYPIGNW